MNDEIFRILVVGDFAGSAVRLREHVSLEAREIDVDNLDDVLRAMKVSVRGLHFNELEDFHPDRIYEALDRFSFLEEKLPPAQKRPAPKDLLSAIIAEQDDSPITAEDASDLPDFLKRITAGHTVPAKDAATLQRDQTRELMAGQAMRAILSDPEVQSIEAAWRTLDLLTRRVETGPQLKIYVLDLSLPEFVANLERLRGALERSGPWALITGNYTFGVSPGMIQSLRRISLLARALNTPFITGGDPTIASAGEPAWQELRESESAAWIGLTLPRYLLRLPYGKETSPIESFRFEEMPQSEHSQYLWGNSAFLVAMLLGQSFSTSGWSMDQIERRVEGMPVHVYRESGEAVAKPCAEVFLTESEAEAMLDRGLIPVISIKHEDSVLIPRIQSIAAPPQPLWKT